MRVDGAGTDGAGTPVRVWLVDEFGHGGIGRYAVDVAALLDGPAAPVVATTDRGPAPGPVTAAQVWFPRPAPGVAGKVVAALTGLLRTARRPGRGDVVWVPLGIRPAYELALVAVARLVGRARVVVTVHNRAPHGRAGDSRAVRLACRLADEVVVHTDALARWAADLGPAVSRVPFPPPRLGPATARERPAGARLVVSLLGYQYGYKGPDLLLRALARTRTDAVGVVLAGTAPPDLDLPGLVRELGLGDRVVLRLGFLTEAGLAGLLDATDVVALPYRAVDNTGIGAAARDRGLPAVASDLPALRELFGDGALYVPPGDVDGLAAALDALPGAVAGLRRRAGAALTDHDALATAYRELARRWAGPARRTGA